MLWTTEYLKTKQKEIDLKVGEAEGLFSYVELLRNTEELSRAYLANL